MMTIKRRSYRVDNTNDDNTEKAVIDWTAPMMTIKRRVIGWTAPMMTIKRRGYRVDRTNDDNKEKGLSGGQHQ